MYRVSLPYTTRTTGVDIFDTDNLYRQRDIDKQIAMLNRDDGTFLKALDLWSSKEPTIQLLYTWVEDDMLDIHTQINLAAGYAASITSIVVDDSRLFVANSQCSCPRTLENMRITAVNYSTHTLTVVRGLGTTPALPLVDNDILISGVADLPENADPNLGTGSVPETEMYNFVSRFSETFTISHPQEVAAMFETNLGKIASIPKEISDKMFEIKRKVNKAMIFQSRGTISTTDGTIYMSQGFVHYVQDNVLDLDSNNGNLTWPILSDWFDTLFDPIASSSEKMLNAGPWLFGAIARMSRDMGTQMEKYYHPQLGADMMEISTEEGNMVKVVRDKHGFPASEGLGSWGIVVDMGLAFKREYTGEPMTWRPKIQDNASHVRKDEYWGSFSLELRHPSCHGYIRNAGQSIIDR